ncbi:MAG: type II toxin-antitoxin system VapC family toxin [Actinomycetota bacterium]|nr:type II toxin-antitoxin system VapC family toxin [Actinomycetota bacterium]
MSDLVTPGAGVFVDTGYLIALEDGDDGNHSPAREHREGLREMPSLTTTSYIVDEVVTFFNVRGQHGKAVELGEALLSSPSVRMVHVGEGLLGRALDLLRRRPDKRYSLTDCVSFVVMCERGIATAFAFDRHFEQEGFVRMPPSPAPQGYSNSGR